MLRADLWGLIIFSMQKIVHHFFVLPISGTNTQLTMWPIEFCYQLVNRGYRVIRFDNRDIGLSEKFDKAGMPDWAAILKAIQEKKKLHCLIRLMIWQMMRLVCRCAGNKKGAYCWSIDGWNDHTTGCL
jgi:hypothetical protein